MLTGQKIYLHLRKSTIHVGKQTSHMYPMMGIHIRSWQVGSSNPRRPVARILGFPNSVTRTNNRFLPALCKKQHQDFCQFVSAVFLLGTRIKLMNFWVSASCGDSFTKKTGFIETDPRPPNPNPPNDGEKVFLGRAGVDQIARMRRVPLVVNFGIASSWNWRRSGGLGPTVSFQGSDLVVGTRSSEGWGGVWGWFTEHGWWKVHHELNHAFKRFFSQLC